MWVVYIFIEKDLEGYFIIDSRMWEFIVDVVGCVDGILPELVA